MDPANTDTSIFGNFLSSVGGTLTKAVDTAVDVVALQQTNKLIGSAYPSGQVNPATAKSQAAADTAANAGQPAAQVMKYMPYILGAVGIILVGALALGMTRRH